MAETFYPFVEGDSPDDDITPPATSARIAVYDDMAMVPRVVAIEPTDIRSYLEEITKTVFELATQQGGDWSFMLIRELVENFIHASFIEPSISILEKGRTLVFSDQGPGIPNKQAALKPSFSSATKSMKRYIRGVGSGLPIVEEQLRLKNGSITIEDNLGHGTIVTVSLAPSQANPPAGQTPLPPQQAAGASIPAGQGTADPSLHAPGAYGAAPQQPGGATAAPPAPYGYGAPAGAPLPYGSQQTYGAPNPYGTSYANPYGAPQQPANPAYQPGYPYGTVPQQPYGAATAGYAPSGAYAPGAYGAALQQPGGATAAPPAPYGYGAPAGAPLPYGSQQTYGSPQPYGGPSAFPGAAPASGPMAVAPAGFDPAAPIPGQTAIDAHAPLTTQQRQIVRLFARYRELGPTELSSELGFSESTGTRRLKDIMAAGYVTKNGQKYILTGEGERMLAYLMDSEV